MACCCGRRSLPSTGVDETGGWLPPSTGMGQTGDAPETFIQVFIQDS